MKNITSFLAPALVLALTAAPAAAQSSGGGTATAEKAAPSTAKPIVIQNIRPVDKRGLTIFEAPKEQAIDFDGFKLDFGAAFTQQFQALSHSNTAADKIVDGVNVNELANLGWGFNLATANFYLNAQLAPGVRVALESYMSSRHHAEFWVKGGYLQIDASPLQIAALENLMKYLTLKIGHFEVNYGDTHFRRTDNGNALYNPFVENYIMDAFATEIGAEAYLRSGGLLAMVGVTNGEIQGGVTNPDRRAPSFIGKVGFDQQLDDLLRVRLTGSVYTTKKSANNTLYAGDRAGSRYYNVMDNAAGADFRNGRINPGLSSKLTAYQINPFVKVGGVELYGVYEKAAGRSAAELEDREWTQYAGDVIYRFLPGESAYLGGRYNTASGQLAGVADKVSLDRVQLGAGWFITPSILLKAEYVTQKYKDFPTLDIRNGGKFSGMIFEGVVAF